MLCSFYVNYALKSSIFMVFPLLLSWLDLNFTITLHALGFLRKILIVVTVEEVTIREIEGSHASSDTQ